MPLRHLLHQTAPLEPAEPQAPPEGSTRPHGGPRTKPPDPKAHILATAALGAITEARWEGHDLLARRAAAAPDLLRGHAAEMAASAVGRDQVLGLALLVAADDLAAGRPPVAGREPVLPEPGPDEAARLRVRERVLTCSSLPTAEARAVAEELERRLRPECASDQDLAARLTAEANLHEILWDDPRLPGDDHARLAMLFSIPELLERAEALGGHRRTASGRRLPWRPRRVAGPARGAWGLALGSVLAVGVAQRHD